MSRLHNKDIVWSLIREYYGWLVRCLGKGLERKTTIKHKHKLHKTLPPTASWSHSNNQLSLIWNTYQRYRWSILWNDPYVAEMISSRWFLQKSNLISNVFVRNYTNTQTDIHNQVVNFIRRKIIELSKLSMSIFVKSSTLIFQA